MANVFASRLGLMAFAATALEAAWSGTDLAGGVTTSLVHLVLFYGLGWLTGLLAGWLVEEQAQAEFERWKQQADEMPAVV